MSPNCIPCESSLRRLATWRTRWPSKRLKNVQNREWNESVQKPSRSIYFTHKFALNIAVLLESLVGDTRDVPLDGNPIFLWVAGQRWLLLDKFHHDRVKRVQNRVWTCYIVFNFQTWVKKNKKTTLIILSYHNKSRRCLSLMYIIILFLKQVERHAGFYSFFQCCHETQIWVSLYCVFINWYIYINLDF